MAPVVCVRWLLEDVQPRLKSDAVRPSCLCGLTTVASPFVARSLSLGIALALAFYAKGSAESVSVCVRSRDVM